MKFIFRCIFYSFLAFLSLTANAEISSSFTKDQQEIIKLIQAFYSVPSNTFLYAEFNGEFKPEKHCPLMRNLIIKESLFKRPKGNYFPPVRYPTIPDEDAIISSAYPTPKIQIPVVKDNLAEVLVLFKNDPGRVHFYMKKTLDGWRIYKSRSDTSADIPENTQNPDDMRALMFTYFPPSADEIERANHPL
jgi:hypothetical protein